MKKNQTAFLLGLIASCACCLYGDSFKIAVIPDTQNYVAESLPTFTQQTQWIVNNRASQEIAFVTHLGDVTENALERGDLAQWDRADDSMSLLDGQLPYSTCIGNHDYSVPGDKRGGAPDFISSFGASRYSGYPWYGGASPLGLSHYQIFTAGGRQWLHLNLEWVADMSVLMWAQEVIDDHPTLPVILSTHAFIGTRLDPNDINDVGLRSASDAPSSNGGGEMWYKFVTHNDQIFIVL